MTGSFAHSLLPTPSSIGTNTTQSCNIKPCTWSLQMTLIKTKNKDYVPIVRLRITSLETVLTHPFMTAHNTLHHLTTGYPDLLCLAILTMNIAQETHVLFICLSCKARSPESPVWTKLTEDQPTITSDTGSMLQRSFTIECDQVYYKPMLTSKHVLQPTRTPLLSLKHFHTCTHSSEAHHQMHSQHTEISTNVCMPSTDTYHQITQSVHWI